MTLLEGELGVPVTDGAPLLEEPSVKASRYRVNLSELVARQDAGAWSAAGDLQCFGARCEISLSLRGADGESIPEGKCRRSVESPTRSAGWVELVSHLERVPPETDFGLIGMLNVPQAPLFSADTAGYGVERALVQAVVERQREALLACGLRNESVVLLAVWDDKGGLDVLELLEPDGLREEACLMQALRAPLSSAGREVGHAGRALLRVSFGPAESKH